MAIPTVKTLEQCSEWSRVVEPYIPQLFDLPGKVLGAATSPAALVELYKATNPLISGFAFSVALGFVFLIVSEINRNYSQVDRMWSLLPTIYNAHFATWTHLHGLPSDRVDLVLAWSILWSTRLTFNYARKGGYNIGSEDYREIIKAQIPAFAFFLLNVTFISFIQSILLFALAAPTYIIMLSSLVQPKVGLSDLFFLGTEIALIASEWFSDQQQWDYQHAKQEYKKTGTVPHGFTQDDLERGFITSGLWAYSRHPNFAAEQTIWILLYQWSCFASNSLYNWSAGGAGVLVMIFQGSTWLTELISGGKYPEYQEYKKQINAFLPTKRAYKPPAVKPTKVHETTGLAAKTQKAAKKSKKL
ncbi:uncharacterized protein B0I36DRAFT_20530 [Microdochium trichocladiopsis]|uniref:DUF1295-domain-containing protein n=1 Tax=Microdochium trichocladiopsis TaxID=1682393 RepID=A0A9P9BWW6_9PEZI|nr:uncharacterized protein B0I36DRAFT_20530 [Microdochium trichocladiopsis]KAH7041202.1 hypothetical protein B0I36DRAFT_20530 [Microdochium trichocladiopsis]